MADISGDSDAVDFSRQTVDPVANTTTNMMGVKYSIRHNTLRIMIDVSLNYGMMKQHHEHDLHRHGDLFLIRIRIHSNLGNGPGSGCSPRPPTRTFTYYRSPTHI